MKRCRLCGFRIWFWQKSLDTMHTRCWYVMMHILYVAYSQLVPGDLIKKVSKVLKTAYNTGEWAEADWTKGKLIVDAVSTEKGR